MVSTAAASRYTEVGTELLYFDSRAMAMTGARLPVRIHETCSTVEKSMMSVRDWGGTTDS